MLDFVAGVVNPFDYPDRNCEILIFTNNCPYIKEEDLGDYLVLAQRYAAEHKAYVVPQLFEREKRLRLCIVDPTGKVIGEQAAFNLNPRNKDRFVKHDQMWIYDVGFARIFLAADQDIMDHNLMAAVKAKGCNLIVSSQYVPRSSFDADEIIEGPWRVAQLNCAFVVNATNLFSSVLSPCAISRRRSFDGFLSGPSLEMPISSELYPRWLKYAKDNLQMRINPRRARLDDDNIL